MPILIPTADEVAAMSWHDRQHWKRRLSLTQRQVSETTRLLKYVDIEGARIADEARALHTGPDPEWRENQQALLEAIR
jgi:hypothetical protein